MQYNHSGDQFVILDFLFSTDGRNLNVSEEKIYIYPHDGDIFLWLIRIRNILCNCQGGYFRKSSADFLQFQMPSCSG